MVHTRRTPPTLGTPRVWSVTVPDRVVVRALGVAVGIEARDAETAARLRHQWVRALTAAPAEVEADTGGLAHLEEVAHDYAMTVRVTMRALEATAGTRLNIHAGAVANDAGAALAVVGASGSGKTTAVRALASRLGYLSDETVSLSSDLTVHAHPKPLSVILDRKDPRHKASVSPDDVGLLTPPEVNTLRRIVLLRRGKGTDGLMPVSTPEAIVEIVPQTSSLVLLDSPLLALSRAIDRCGGALALHYDEIDDHLDELVDLVAQAPLEQAPAVHHPTADLPAPSGAQWSRVPWRDAVQYDDDLVVMVGDTAHLLHGLGTTVWLALARPTSVVDLVAVAEEEHGPHPHASGLVEVALAQLTEQGLVSRPRLPTPRTTSGRRG